MNAEQTEQTLRKAHETLAALTEKRAEAERYKVEIGTARQQVAFDAAAGDKAAGRRLAELTEGALRADLALENADHAITEARRRVTVAEAAVAFEARRADAERGRRIVDEMRSAGAELGAGAAALVHGYEVLLQRGGELHALGFGPSHQNIRVYVRRAIASALGGHGLSELLAPSERISMDALIDKWAAFSEDKIAMALGEASAQSEGA